MKSLFDFTNNQIQYKNFSEEVRLIKETKAGISYSKYTCTNKNGVTFQEVPGFVGLTGAAVMGYVNGDRSRPVIIGPATKPTIVKSSFIEGGWYGDRAIFAGGATSGGSVATIEYASIPTFSNTSNFGNLLGPGEGKGACSNRSRGVIGGSGVFEYITFATLGNSTSFGSSASSRTGISACSNGSRGVFASTKVGVVTNIEYIALASSGNSNNFGDMVNDVISRGACSNGSRGVFFGGAFDTPTPRYVTDSIEFINIASTANSSTFGSLSDIARGNGTAIGSPIYGIFAGGGRQDPTYTPPFYFDFISVVSIASAGNSTSFGTLSSAKNNMAGAHNGTRALFAGGFAQVPYPTPAYYSVIEYLTIASSGSVSNFGNLSVAKHNLAGTSGD